MSETSRLDDPSICILPWSHAIVYRDSVNACCYPKHPLSFRTEPWGSIYQSASWDFFKRGEHFTQWRRAMLEQGHEQTCGQSFCDVQVEQKTPRAMLEGYRRVFPHHRHLIDWTAQDIEEGRLELSHAPLFCQAVTNYHCNLRCPFCVQNQAFEAGSGRPMLSDWELGKLGEAISHTGFCRLLGGETLLLNDDALERLFAHPRQSQTQIGLTTNGQRLSLERYERWCMGNPVVLVDISIDTVDEAAYRQSRGGDGRRVRANIEAIAAKHQPHTLTTLISVVSYLIQGTTRELVQFAHDVGVRNVVFNVLVGSGMEQRELGPLNPFGEQADAGRNEEFIAELNETFAYAGQVGVNILMPERILQALAAARACVGVQIG